jgi:predicted GIY-YIG superfamily endonuclease
VSKKLLYIIENERLQLTKIGITDNLNRRLRQLECASGCKLNIYYNTELINHAKLIEKSLHEYFKIHRKEGEYFMLNPEIIKEKLLFVLNNLTKIYKDNL